MTGWLLLALCLAATPAQAQSPEDPSSEPLSLSIARVRLDAGKPGLTRVGLLEFRGALEITSRHPDFGGLSGLEVDDAGQAFYAISDRGRWVGGKLLYDERGWLSGLAGVAIGPLHDPQGNLLGRKEVQDAESLARLPDGSLLVAFEHRHRIWRYAGDPQPLADLPVAWPTPAGLTSLPENNGVEAMTALADGQVLAIAESESEPGRFPAWLWRDGHWRRLSYRRTNGYRPSGAALLPDGDLLVLERRFSWLGGLAARLVRVPAEEIVLGSVLEGEELAVLAPPLLIDNWEGVATALGPAGETLIYLISDDNFLPIQRNLLALFALTR